MVPLPALKRGFRKTLRSSIGCPVWSSHARNVVSNRPASHEGPDDQRVAPPLRGAFDDSEQQRGQPEERQHRSEWINSAVGGTAWPTSG